MLRNGSIALNPFNIQKLLFQNSQLYATRFKIIYTKFKLTTKIVAFHSRNSTLKHIYFFFLLKLSHNNCVTHHIFVFVTLFSVLHVTKVCIRKDLQHWFTCWFQGYFNQGRIYYNPEQGLPNFYFLLW